MSSVGTLSHGSPTDQDLMDDQQQNQSTAADQRLRLQSQSDIILKIEFFQLFIRLLKEDTGFE